MGWEFPYVSTYGTRVPVRLRARAHARAGPGDPRGQGDDRRSARVARGVATAGRRRSSRTACARARASSRSRARTGRVYHTYTVTGARPVRRAVSLVPARPHAEVRVRGARAWRKDEYPDELVSERSRLTPAFMAVRARLGLVALVTRLGRRRWVVDRRSDGRHGRRPGDRPRRARLVPVGLGGDDGRDDAPVAGADGRALRTNDRDSAGSTARWRLRGGYLLRVAVSRAYSRTRPVQRRPEPVRRRPGVVGRRALVGGGRDGRRRGLRADRAEGPCLGKCRSPVRFLLGTWRDGRLGALAMGSRQAAGAWAAAGR